MTEAARGHSNRNWSIGTGEKELLQRDHQRRDEQPERHLHVQAPEGRRACLPPPAGTQVEAHSLLRGSADAGEGRGEPEEGAEHGVVRGGLDGTELARERADRLQRHLLQQGGEHPWQPLRSEGSQPRWADGVGGVRARERDGGDGQRGDEADELHHARARRRERRATEAEAADAADAVHEHDVEAEVEQEGEGVHEHLRPYDTVGEEPVVEGLHPERGERVADRQRRILARETHRIARHVDADAEFFSGDNAVGLVYNLTEVNLMPFYVSLAQESKLRVLVYNGDTDPSINSFLAQNWTSHLGLEETEEWRPWTLDGKDYLGGYVTRYKGDFDFLTIRGSGHMVPQYKPKVTFAFLKKWLDNEEWLRWDGKNGGEL